MLPSSKTAQLVKPLDLFLPLPLVPHFWHFLHCSILLFLHSSPSDVEIVDGAKISFKFLCPRLEAILNESLLHFSSSANNEQISQWLYQYLETLDPRWLQSCISFLYIVTGILFEHFAIQKASPPPEIAKE